MTVPVTLAQKNWLMEEPVFRDLKKILVLYGGLSAAQDDADRVETLKALLGLFFVSKPPSLNRISAEELVDFLQKIPVACGLETTAKKQGSDKPIDWGYLYGHLCASMGWDYDYVDSHMTMSRLKELNSYWLAHPPTHLLVAAFMGYEAKEQDSVKSFFERVKSQIKG